MTTHQKIAASATMFSFGGLLFRPEAVAVAVVLIMCILLYGFTIYLEHRADAEIEALEARLSKQIDDLHAKVQGLLIQRGMGR